MSTFNLVLTVQFCTFVALGLLFLHAGNWRLGASQLLLAAIQLLIYAT